MTDCVVAITTLPADFDARSLAEALVTDGLAACVAVVPSIESIYAWEGVLQHDREQQVVIKTTREAGSTRCGPRYASDTPTRCRSSSSFRWSTAIRLIWIG